MQTRVMDWFARIVVFAVFVANVMCALQFIIDPAAFSAAFELTGTAGDAAIQGLGIAFLMWNATYPLVIIDPARHEELFGVVLAQQAIGLLGETVLRLTLPAGHVMLAASLMRFIVFDAAGLVSMLAVFIPLLLRRRNARLS